MEAVPMDISTSGEASPSIEDDGLTNGTLLPAPQVLDHSQLHRIGHSTRSQFPSSMSNELVLHILTSYGLDPRSFALLEASCSFFRHAVNIDPYYELSMAECAAFEMCRKRAVCKHMTPAEGEALKERCGGSWKLVLKYLMMGESCYRREKFQAIAGPGHSIVVASSGDVYSFGLNTSGQLGHDTVEGEYKPKIIRSLEGIRIIQAAVGDERTMLVSDSGKIYTFGKDLFTDDYEEEEDPIEEEEDPIDVVTTPKLLDSLKDVFVVQATIGGCMSAVLSREGRVYTFSWGTVARLGHRSDIHDREPRLLKGPLEDALVVQISAGYCYLLALAVHPNGTNLDAYSKCKGRLGNYLDMFINLNSRSVYSVGCGLGGKLGHGTLTNEEQPRMIEHFQTLNFKPIAIAAGAWHAVALGQDGRVCTWGWGHCGCLGHGTEERETLPRVVEGLEGKAIHVAAGTYTTFVVCDNGNTYSFGWNGFSNLGQATVTENHRVLNPERITFLSQENNQRIVQISNTNGHESYGHTFVLTDSGKLYAFGGGQSGQLGVRLDAAQIIRKIPELVNINDLS